MNWIILPFLFLWGLLLYHLSTRWETNEQYSYGWTVPFICLGMMWSRWKAGKNRPRTTDHGTTVNRTTDNETTDDRTADQVSSPVKVSSLLSVVSGLVFVFLALLYLPTRFLQVELQYTRAVDWLLTIEVVGISLASLYFFRGWSALWKYAFPICFILVAVPWPGPIERPLIQGLQKWNTFISAEVVGMLGIPALIHGTTIEIGTGVVGVNEACSGIRSFQSTVMLSLFLGEMLRLNITRRMFLFVSGLLLAFFFNVCRTSFLVWVASKNGIGAVSTWHDSAGLSILVACLVSLYLMGLFLKRGMGKKENGLRTTDHGPRTTDYGTTKEDRTTDHGLRNTNQLSTLKKLSVFLIIWLVIVEAGTWAWSRQKNSLAAANPEWSVNWPKENSSFKLVPVDQRTRSVLGCDKIQQGAWFEEDGTKWQVFLIEWLPSRLSRLLAKNHKPEVCLKCLGYEMLTEPEPVTLKVKDLSLPFKRYVFKAGGSLMHVFFCNWEAKESNTAGKSGHDLLRGITSGKGHFGQQVLEVAVIGFDDPLKAQEAVVHQLEKLIVVKGTE